MRYYAGYAESFYFAYTNGRHAFDRAPRSRATQLGDCVDKLSQIKAINLEQYGIYPAPPTGPGSLGPEMAGRHPLVSGNGNRHQYAGATRHSWNAPIPPGAFALVGPGLYVSTPEFTFLQLARCLPLEQMAIVGCALCASYRLDPKTGAICQCEPLTSVDAIRGFLDKASETRGYRTAQKCLDLIADGAESPQEVNLYLLSSMPLSLGGSAIKDLKLNYTIEAKPEDGPILDRPNRECFRIDMGVPSRGVGVEYLGKHHESQQVQDRERQNALLAKGERILQVKYQDISNPVMADRLTCQLAALLNTEPPARTPAQMIAHAQLMDALFGPGRLRL